MKQSSRRELYTSRKPRPNAPNPMEARECPQAKISYPSKAMAKEQASINVKKYGMDQTYPYRCPHCRLFHLTSQEQS